MISSTTHSDPAGLASGCWHSVHPRPRGVFPSRLACASQSAAVVCPVLSPQGKFGKPADNQAVHIRSRVSPTSTNEQIYSAMASPIIKNVLKGHVFLPLVWNFGAGRASRLPGTTARCLLMGRRQQARLSRCSAQRSSPASRWPPSLMPRNMPWPMHHGSRKKFGFNATSDKSWRRCCWLVCDGRCWASMTSFTHVKTTATPNISLVYRTNYTPACPI